MRTAFLILLAGRLATYLGWACKLSNKSRRFVSLSSFLFCVRRPPLGSTQPACATTSDVQYIVMFLLTPVVIVGRTSSPSWGWLGIHGDFFSFLIFSLILLLPVDRILKAGSALSKPSAVYNTYNIIDNSYYIRAYRQLTIGNITLLKRRLRRSFIS
ncbi:hypothetical protein F4806DRAFT_67030 [Annulohypoxylon nitens]|nr:hypothetical protein F4806DRAFT_67030 [Annulohypoxylon nitens]